MTLREEKNPAVRVVLGHFFFVYIHPYMDGNGRIGRFLMNVMMAAGGYPWTIVPVGDRARYMNALETASTKEDIAPFADFITQLSSQGLAGERLPEIPKTFSAPDERSSCAYRQSEKRAADASSIEPRYGFSSSNWTLLPMTG